MDIPSAKGAKRHGSLETTLKPNKDGEAFATLAFTLSEPVPDLEFRLIIRDPATDLTLERIELTRLGAP